MWQKNNILIKKDTFCLSLDLEYNAFHVFILERDAIDLH